MSMREIEAKFTKSELAICAWRSQEQYFNMTARMNRTEDRDEDYYPAPSREELQERFEDIKRTQKPRDEMDVSKMTGAQVLAMYRQAGIIIPFIAP